MRFAVPSSLERTDSSTTHGTCESPAVGKICVVPEQTGGKKESAVVFGTWAQSLHYIQRHCLCLDLKLGGGATEVIWVGPNRRHPEACMISTEPLHHAANICCRHYRRQYSASLLPPKGLGRCHSSGIQQAESDGSKLTPRPRPCRCKKCQRARVVGQNARRSVTANREMARGQRL